MVGGGPTPTYTPKAAPAPAAQPGPRGPVGPPGQSGTAGQNGKPAAGAQAGKDGDPGKDGAKGRAPLFFCERLGERARAANGKVVMRVVIVRRRVGIGNSSSTRHRPIAESPFRFGAGLFFRIAVRKKIRAPAKMGCRARTERTERTAGRARIFF